jgi:hypothetical protein
MSRFSAPLAPTESQSLRGTRCGASAVDHCGWQPRPRRERAPSNPSLFPAPCSSGLLVRAHLRPGLPAPCGTGSGGPATRPKTSPAPQLRYCPRPPSPKVWYPVTPLRSVDRLLSPKSLAPLGSVSFRGLREHTDAAPGRQRLFGECSGPTRNPCPVTELRPLLFELDGLVETKWDNPVHDGPAYPQRARQWGSGTRRPPVDSAVAGRHEPGSWDGRDGV